MLAWVSWWLAASLLGVLAFPITQRIFYRLPDRGHAFARPLGILLASYTLWLGATAGVLRNSTGGALAGVLVLAGAGWLAGRGRWADLREWVRSNRSVVLVTELVTLVGFGVWAWVRANNPEIQHTEKPMELAFLNSILRSSSFPPADPWLSGHAISYYYFGYVMLALLTQLTGVSSGVAFNLGNALWFGLVAAGSFGLLYNLLRARGRQTALAPSLLGPAFVLLAGNLEGFLDVLHARQLFWRILPDGTYSSGFWRWLDIKQLVDAPVTDPSWIPARFLWWWRASRVVRDVNLAGVDIEVIDEFPFFSFLLADNHPHLLAIPFALMAVGFALQIFLRQREDPFRLGSRPPTAKAIRRAGMVGVAIILAVVSARAASSLAQSAGIDNPLAMSASEIVLRALGELVLAAVVTALLGFLYLFARGGFTSGVDRSEYLFGAWLFGALAFLNTWDSPIYLALLLAVLYWKRAGEPAWENLKLVGVTGLAMGLGAVLLYLPWYPTFSSQAGGILPNLIFPTKLQHFTVMFGVSFVPILGWLLWRLVGGWRKPEVRPLLGIGIGLPLVLLVLSLTLALFINFAFLSDPLRVEALLADLGLAGEPLQDSLGTLSRAIASRRLAHSWTALTLGATVAAGFILLKREAGRRAGTGNSVYAEAAGSTWPFVVLLIAVGALLVLGPEYLYLRDLFGTRMNTVFKFYFATWILWGLAAAYAAVELWPKHPRGREALRILVVIPLLLGFIYPVFATWTKTNGFSPPMGKTLDGTAYLQAVSPADHQAIGWMNDRLATGVVAEAVGGSYTQYGRVSAHTGLSAVLGWDFHELQWRGSMAPQGTRSQDIQVLYQAPDWPDAASVVDRYAISYIYVGPLERASYQPLSLRKFDQHLDKIYDDGEVIIYATPQGSGP